MRTALVILPVIGLAFMVGLACGLVLRAPVSQPGPVRRRGVPGTGFDIGDFPRHPRAGATGRAAAPEASDDDGDWDTYDSGAAAGEPG